jgi:hypothetical protein
MEVMRCCTLSIVRTTRKFPTQSAPNTRMRTSRIRIMLGGAMLDEGGETRLGSTLILNVKSLACAVRSGIWSWYRCMFELVAVGGR